MLSSGYLNLLKKLDTSIDVILERIFINTEKPRIIPKNNEIAGFSFENDCIYSTIVTGKIFLIESAREFSGKCRFCPASYLNLPARYPDIKKINEHNRTIKEELCISRL